VRAALGEGARVGIRIGFDLDGVLADMDAAVAAVTQRLFGAGSAPLTPEETDAGPETNETDVEQAPAAEAVVPPSRDRNVWREIRGTENFWETLGETEAGAVARLAELADERGWEIVFLTQRPPTSGVTVQRQSQRWLAALGFAYPSVCVVDGSRGKVAAALGLNLVVDDRPENCLDVVSDSKAKAVLIWRGEQQHAVPNARRLGIEVVGSIGECLDNLAAGRWLPTSRGVGLIGRVKTWLGALGSSIFYFSLCL
jgi:beta-phosphoglucomutase-like phosphatase (HAD superfamily)